MSMAKIVFFEVEEWEKPIIQKAFGDDVLLVADSLTADTVMQYRDAEIISPFIYSKLTKEVLKEFPHLSYITTRSTGFDHIDLTYCKEKGIAVSNVPAYGVHTVAEHAFTLILGLSRKLVQSVERTRKGNFSIEGLEGFDLNGKTLGVIGAGKIGTTVIHIARCFGMDVFVYTRHPQVSDNHHVTFADLDTVLGKSDIVTLHLPLTLETKHFINKDTIKKFKKGAYLINTARGDLVETECLLEALESGHLAGAGLDVLEGEMDIKEERELLASKFLKTGDMKIQLLNHVLMQQENVLITPHNAFHTKEAVQEILDITIQNIHTFESGKKENSVF